MFTTLTSTMKLWIGAGLLAAILLLGFCVGYRWKGYVDIQTQKNTLEGIVKQQAIATDKMLADNAKVVSRVDALNEATASSQLNTSKMIEGQINDIHRIQSAIATLAVGTCNFNPVSDRLWNDAYRTVFPNAASPAKNNKATH